MRAGVVNHPTSPTSYIPTATNKTFQDIHNDNKQRRKTKTYKTINNCTHIQYIRVFFQHTCIIETVWTTIDKKL